MERADREKGRLRTFLLTSLQNFLINEHDREKAIKRGGDRIILSLDELLPEAEVNILASAHLDDVACYDLTWATSIVARSWQRLCEVLEAEGKSQWLDELRPFLAGGTATPKSGGSRGSDRCASRDAPHLDFAPASALSRCAEN